MKNLVFACVGILFLFVNTSLLFGGEAVAKEQDTRKEIAGKEFVNIKLGEARLNCQVLEANERLIRLRTADGKELSIPPKVLEPAEVFACRMQVLPTDDAEAHHALGLFCREHGLDLEAEQMRSQASALDPKRFPPTVKSDSPPKKGAASIKVQKLTVESAAFKDKDPLPQRYLEANANGYITPPLNWSAPPESTVEIVVMCLDLDFAHACHWLVYGLDGKRREIPEGLPPGRGFSEPIHANQGLTDVGWPEGGYGWRPPAPPAGQKHRYVFRVYALDQALQFRDLKEGPKKSDFLREMRGHILAMGEIVVTAETLAIMREFGR